MRIGIDVDNTITDTLPVMKEYCKKYNEEVVKRNLPMNEKGFAASNLYDWKDEERQDFFDNILPQVFSKVQTKENAKDIINKLKKEGNSIYIITARTKIKEPYRVTQEMLERYGIDYDELIIQKDKKQCCIDKKIDILIDDEPQNITSVSEIIPVIAFEALHNEECEGNNIIKVNTWNEVYDTIKEIEKKGDQ